MNTESSFGDSQLVCDVIHFPLIRSFDSKEGLMARSYSEDLRVRVIAAVRGGLSTRQTAARFGIGVSTVGTWYRRYRATGEIAARKQGQPGGSKLAAHGGLFWP